MIDEEELVKAIVKAAALAVVAKIAEDDLGKDDKDVEDNEDWMVDGEEIAADLPEEMTFGPDDDFLPYESD